MSVIPHQRTILSLACFLLCVSGAHAQALTQAEGSTTPAAASAPAKTSVSMDDPEFDPLNLDDETLLVLLAKDPYRIYDNSKVRGFSPDRAGSLRIEGMYFNRAASLSHLPVDFTALRIGASATATMFPAPSGIVDYQLKKPGDTREILIGAAMENTAYGRGDRELNISAALPLSKPDEALRYGVVVNASGLQEMSSQREPSLYKSVSLVGRIRSAEDVTTPFEILPFYSMDLTPYETPHSYWQALEGKLPPSSLMQLPFPKSLAVPWLRTSGIERTYGLIGSKEFADDWQLRGSIIRSHARFRNYFDQIITQNPNQKWTRTLYTEHGSELDQGTAETRLSKKLKLDEFTQTFSLLWRGKHGLQRFGTENIYNLGSVSAAKEQPTPVVPEYPDIVEKSRDRLRQQSWGAAYEIQYGKLTLDAGLQRTSYEHHSWYANGKKIIEQNHSATVTQPYWNLTAQLTDTLMLYASQTRGLEDGGTAPVSADNRYAVMPSSQTREHSIGVRWNGLLNGKAVNAVFGYFEVSKPYFSYLQSGDFGQIGDVRNRGFEGSIGGNLTDQLSLMSSLVWMDSVIQRPKFPLATSRPAGSTPVEWRNSVEYKLQWIPQATLEFGTQYSGAQTSSDRSDTRLPKKMLVDTGVRYQFKMGTLPTQVRFQISNLFNRDYWVVDSDNIFEVGKPRTWRFEINTKY